MLSRMPLWKQYGIRLFGESNSQRWPKSRSGLRCRTAVPVKQQRRSCLLRQRGGFEIWPDAARSNQILKFWALLFHEQIDCGNSRMPRCHGASRCFDGLVSEAAPLAVPSENHRRLLQPMIVENSLRLDASIGGLLLHRANWAVCPPLAVFINVDSGVGGQRCCSAQLIVGVEKRLPAGCRGTLR